MHVRAAEGRAIYSGWAHDLGELKKMLEPWGSELSVAMEATTGAFFLVDELRDVVKEVMAQDRREENVSVGGDPHDAFCSKPRNPRGPGPR